MGQEGQDSFRHTVIFQWSVILRRSLKKRKPRTMGTHEKLLVYSALKIMKVRWKGDVTAGSIGRML